MKRYLFQVTPECAACSVFTERGVCANRLRKELRQSAGHPETREPPWHHRAEGWRADHPQVTQGLFTRRQLGHNPDGHHKEHRPRSGQAQRGEIRKGNYFIHDFVRGWLTWYWKLDSLLVQYLTLTVDPSHLKRPTILSDRCKPLSSFPWTSVITSWPRSTTCWGPEFTWKRPRGESWRRWVNTGFCCTLPHWVAVRVPVKANR